MKPELIAEIKTASPFGFRSNQSFDDLARLALDATRDAGWVAVHTDPRWGGSFELLRAAKIRGGVRSRPWLLAKGIHGTNEDVRQAFAAGADAVLVVGRLDAVPFGWHRNGCWFEPTCVDQLAGLPTTIPVVWNARDLQTGRQKRETFEEARAAYLGWLCQASFIRSPVDVQHGADAVLVGEHLVEYLS